MKSRNLTASVLLIILALGLPAQDAAAYRLSEQRDWKLPAEGISSLRLRNGSGAIEVIGWDRDEIEILATIRIRAASKNMAQDICARIDFEIVEERGNISLGALVPKYRKLSMSGEGNTAVRVDYSIRVPYSIDVDIKAKNGDIAVIRLEGNFRIVNGRGAIDMISRGGQGLLQTGIGDIGCEIAYLPAGGKLRIKTGNGDLSLGIPDETSARLKARTGAGRTKVLLPLADIEKNKRKIKKGVLGGGDGEIVLESAAGDITVGGL
jgi:hypothetical protein